MPIWFGIRPWVLFTSAIIWVFCDRDRRACHRNCIHPRRQSHRDRHSKCRLLRNSLLQIEHLLFSPHQRHLVFIYEPNICKKEKIKIQLIAPAESVFFCYLLLVKLLRREGGGILDAFIKVFNWVMLIVSIIGFGRLLYNERWVRAAVASVLTGIALYTMIFF